MRRPKEAGKAALEDVVNPRLVKSRAFAGLLHPEPSEPCNNKSEPRKSKDSELCPRTSCFALILRLTFVAAYLARAASAKRAC